MTDATMYADYQRYVSLLAEYKPEVIIGFDETGNGAIAGPLCVGACALDPAFDKEVKDSKRYSSDSAREKAYQMVKENALEYKSFMVAPNEIHRLGHAKALESLYIEALEFMYEKFGDRGLYILDGNVEVEDVYVPHTALVKADDFINAVSAASIVAKRERDEIMKTVEPADWAFAKTKGYPTPEHLKLLEELGPIRGLHRMNIERVRKAFDDKGWYNAR
jgi:ribonuclease HII